MENLNMEAQTADQPPLLFLTKLGRVPTSIALPPFFPQASGYFLPFRIFISEGEKRVKSRILSFQ